ncbi:MAG: hypothetical protein U0324_33910 [Polyangiales bacterium]
MKVRYRTIALALALSLCPPAALAQVVTAVPVRAPDPAPAAPEPDELTAPELPTPPAALARRVAALTRVVEQTEECYSYHGERIEHSPDARCAGWYASLARGGDAAAYAIGEVLNRPAVEESVGRVRATMGNDQRGPRLVQVLAATRSPVAAPFLLRYVADGAGAEGGFDEAAEESLRQLARLAGYDAHPVAPWESSVYDQPEPRQEAARRWLRWWRSQRDVPPAERLAAGAERAVADLTHADPAVRFAAMQRLVSAPAHRAAVAEAARALLADENLPARAVTHVTRWARRNRLPLAPAAAPTVAAR